MKKRFLPIFIAGFLSCLTLASCHSVNLYEYTENESYANHYLVSFYVDDTLYTTAQVKEGETISVTISDPSKENYSFDGWVLEDGTAFDVSTAVITSNLDVYASFSLINTGGTNPWDELVVTDTKEENKDYYLVIGWYGHTSTSGLDEGLVKHWYYNLRVFLEKYGASTEDLDNISVRKYGIDGTKIAEFGELVNTHGDVDIVIGVGNNINSTGGVDIVDKSGGFTFDNDGESYDRYTALLTEETVSRAVYDFLCTDLGKTTFQMDVTLTSDDIEISQPWDDLFVTDTKDPNKTYSLVIGWYGKTSTSGIDENIMKHWYYNALVYLRHIGLTEEQLNGVTVRQYGDADTNIGPLGELVNAHADVDILLGTGKNLTTQGNIETVDRIDGVTINGTTGRTLALLKESEIGRSLFDFLKQEPGSKMFDMSFILSDSDLGTI